MYVCMCVCMYVCMHACMHVGRYVCMYVGMCEAAFISFSCVPFVPRLVMVRICHRWKNKAFHDFPSFSRTWIFFLRRLSL